MAVVRRVRLFGAVADFFLNVTLTDSCCRLKHLLSHRYIFKFVLTVFSLFESVTVRSESFSYVAVVSDHFPIAYCIQLLSS